MGSEYSVLVILAILSFAWCIDIYSGNEIDMERLQGVWFLTFGVDYWSWNVLWKCHIIAPFNVTENTMNFYTYNVPWDKSELPNMVTEEIRRDSLGQYWMHPLTHGKWHELETKLYLEQPPVDTKIKPSSHDEPWFDSQPHFFSTDYNTFYSHLTLLNDGQKLFQFYTRTPRINQKDMSKFTAIAVDHGIDPSTLTTFGCSDLIPSDYLLD
uniref:uncharacterized protein LOC120342546 n=1 Tax=Styela clava TaxID=7725 RepID=UPI001939680E|nr:uncharacterized protein LOC120342546 [Styela clava]